MDKSKTQIHPGRTVSYLYKSDFFEIKNWSFESDQKMAFNKEYNDCLCIVHMQSGALNKKGYQLTTGQVTLERPNFEYELLPSFGSSTIINFSDDFYLQLKDELQIDNIFRRHSKDILSVKATASPESEFVLLTLLNSLHHENSVQVDALVTDFLNELLATTWAVTGTSLVPQSHNKRHQEAIEISKEYLQMNFAKAISLTELSRHCGVSLFYLSRLFKHYTTYSPHQYLSNVRLKHGEMLVKDTSLSIVDITYAAGFTSPEYFSTLFKKKYNHSPTSYRQAKSKRRTYAELKTRTDI